MGLFTSLAFLSILMLNCHCHPINKVLSSIPDMECLNRTVAFFYSNVFEPLSPEANVTVLQNEIALCTDPHLKVFIVEEKLCEYVINESKRICSFVLTKPPQDGEVKKIDPCGKFGKLSEHFKARDTFLYPLFASLELCELFCKKHPLICEYILWTDNIKEQALKPDVSTSVTASTEHGELKEQSPTKKMRQPKEKPLHGNKAATTTTTIKPQGNTNDASLSKSNEAGKDLQAQKPKETGVKKPQNIVKDDPSKNKVTRNPKLSEDVQFSLRQKNQQQQGSQEEIISTSQVSDILHFADDHLAQPQPLPGGEHPNTQSTHQQLSPSNSRDIEKKPVPKNTILGVETDSKASQVSEQEANVHEKEQPIKESAGEVSGPKVDNAKNANDQDQSLNDQAKAKASDNEHGEDSLRTEQTVQSNTNNPLSENTETNPPAQPQVNSGGSPMQENTAKAPSSKNDKAEIKSNGLGLVEDESKQVDPNENKSFDKKNPSSKIEDHHTQEPTSENAESDSQNTHDDEGKQGAKSKIETPADKTPSDDKAALAGDSISHTTNKDTVHKKTLQTVDMKKEKQPDDKTDQLNGMPLDSHIPQDIINDAAAAGQDIPESKKVPQYEAGSLEPESSHFFPYFLTIVALCILGYVLFHNKQKIIALVIEGRHQRRRRSNGGNYRRLDNNLADVMEDAEIKALRY